MKRLLPIACWLAITSPLAAAPPRQIHKVVIWVQSKDPGMGTQIEQRLREDLTNSQVDARGFSVLFPKGSVPSTETILRDIRTQGFDSFLSIRPRGAIQWGGTNPPATLEAFLKKYVRSPKPGVDAVEMEPVRDDIEPMPQVGLPGSQPIPGSTTQGTWEIIKGGAIVFDVASGQPLWKEKLTLRTPKGLPTDRYVKRISEDIRDILAQAGLIPPFHR